MACSEYMLRLSAECVVGDCWDGHGKFRYDDQSVYTGIFAEGQRQGHGNYTYPDGGVYVGGFAVGHRHGEGIFVGADTRYDGGWRGGRHHGHGTWSRQSGQRVSSQYDGDWQVRACGCVSPR
jgi:hypothetical protein